MQKLWPNSQLSHMTIKDPSPLSAIRLHKQREEKQAFQAYAAALRKWERARERADDAAWEFQLACAELHQKSIAGTSADAVSALRRRCRKLQEDNRRLQSASAEAKAEASALFTALVHARNARQALDQCDGEKFDSAVTIVGLGTAIESIGGRAFQWN